MKSNIYKFVSNDKFCPQICGVYHDPETGRAVATDTTVLLASYDDYKPEYARQVIGKDGNPVQLDENRHFPKYAHILPDEQRLKREQDTFPVDKFYQAVQNAANFLKNVPQTWADGSRIASNQRIVYLAFKVYDSYAQTDVPIYLSYKYAKLIAELPQDGANMYCRGSRRPVHYRNEKYGLSACIMPVNRDGDWKTLEGGIYNEREGKEGAEGMYLGLTWITPEAPEGSEAERLYRTPEKKEAVPVAKCIERKEGGCNIAAVHHHPLADMVPIAGTETFFRREAKPDKRYKYTVSLGYKLENGFYVCFGQFPSEDAQAIKVIAPMDRMSIRELAKAKNFDSPVLDLYYQRAGA